MGDGECHLDELLDILDQDDDFEEEILNNQSQDNGKETKPNQEDVQNVSKPIESESQPDPEKEALRRKLQEMEEQMKMIQSQLGNSKNDGESQQGTSKNSQSMREVDMFASNSKHDDKGLHSPIKTNPLREAERPVKLAQYEPRSSDWCPSLIKTTNTRVIKGSEAEKLRQSLDVQKANREMADIARNDLADSDDEEVNAFGKSDSDITRNKLKPLTSTNSTVTSGNWNSNSSRVSHVATNSSISSSSSPRGKTKNQLVERHSQLRISSPRISQQDLDSLITGRKMVTMSRISHAAATKQCDGDWVTLGVLYYKHPPKTSSSGNDFSTWKLTDLRGDIVTVTMFLFGKAHKEHWKMPLNKVVGILNPKIMDGKDAKKNDVTISIDHPDKLMEFGESVDLGSCDFVKPSGQKCTNIVNRAMCNYCVYHLKSAYKNSASARSSLQSSYSGGGGNEMTRQRIMNKIAGKGETIFAGGQILNNQPQVVGKKSAASKAKDNRLLASLGGVVTTSGGSKMVNEVVNTGKYKGKPMGSLLSHEQKAVVAKMSENVSEELGARLLAPTPGARMLLSTVCKEEKEKEEKKNPVVKKSAKDLIQEHKQSLQFNSPKLGRGLSKTGEFSLDISPSMKKNYMNASQAKAMAILKMKGNKLAKLDPNNTHRSKNRTPDVKDKILKRIRSEDDDDDSQGSNSENEASNANKKQRTEGKTVMVFGKEVKVDDLEAARSKTTENSHLVNAAELEAVDNYFLKAEAKDAIEQKMLDTKSVKVKAVTCSICNYTDFKSSELCKQQGHKVKLIEATKRFFSCKDCKRRTISLDRLPKRSCDKCGGNSWERVGMIAERKGPKLDHEMLSVRGNEETFLGSTKGPVNINI